MGEVKNFKKAGDTAKQVAQASKNPGAALKLGKALFDDKNSKISNSNAVLMFVFAILFLKEKPTLRQIISTIIILVCVVLAILFGKTY